LKGGSSVEESAKIFMNILEGKGTTAQRQVVIANAGTALYCADQKAGMEVALAKATESLESGRALTAFKKLMQH
jgi:anthranilate phosphoribosyltransferase